jgi:TldD protein
MGDAFVVRDTPSLKEFNGRPTAGSYVVDDEGVRVKDVTLVANGRLVTLLTGRTPHKQFPQSNGHGRSGTVLAGVFQVESTQAVPAADLKRKYLALLKAQEKPFGYIVRGVRSEGQSGDGGPGIDEIVKVTPDGIETPVRGMRFGNIAPTAFRDIAEASSERQMLSYRAGATSAVSVIAPGLIFEELEVHRVREILQKPAVVPSPLK